MGTEMIGLIGAPGAGKDNVVAKRLVEKYNFKRLAFADKIKDYYYKHIGITDEIFKECRGTPEEDKIRDGLWKYSDEMRETRGNKYFITPVIQEAYKNDKIVITDIRTQEELYEILLCFCKPKIIVVVRGGIFKGNNNFPGTRIPHDCIESFLRFASCFSEFSNNSNALEYAYKDFDKFYQLIGGIMSSDRPSDFKNM